MRYFSMTAFVAAFVLLISLCAAATVAAAPDDGPVALTNPPQIPLCMIGDSITWAGDGDYWRLYMLEHLPRLAFVGTHSAVLGYSHAGEGGNSTSRILARMADIPDCPYYHLMIGTNDNSHTDPNIVEERAQACAGRIEQIVAELLKKPSVKKVFLASILPCDTDKPLRDTTNSRTNEILRDKLGVSLPEDRVVWIEYEMPIRDIEGWGPLILLHPTKAGYKIVAKITTDAIIEELGITDPKAVPQIAGNCGVAVENLWDAVAAQTTKPLIAGWYTLSFEVSKVDAETGVLTVHSLDTAAEKHLSQDFAVDAANTGKRIAVNFFTGYEGYQYTRDKLAISFAGLQIKDIMIEKQRPSKAPSAYAVGTFIDTSQTPAPGELIEAVGK